MSCFGIRTNEKEKYALISQQIAINYRFDVAQQQAQNILQAFMNEYKPEVSSKLSFSPSDPKNSGDFCYETGYLVYNHEQVEADIAKFKGIGYDTLKVRVIKGGNWAVYKYVGGYEGLGRAWETAKSELAKSGRKACGEGATPFEMYLTNPQENSGVKPISEIWLPVE
ncbi:hypothetical protein HK103_007339 [Boothiomyces macroporosus]|uniref:AraC effector-binding domain-containing protein n=1 Tax=Boothiomyces macroporosus TaxID=261099 RepID=A0AAD5UKQ2_9FUNG|nr:hypothetical protein HK103_007339 [Boothiomyces macroporosus]